MWQLGCGEEVAGLGVAGDQPQRLTLAAAPDEDRRVRPGQGLGRVQGPFEVVVPPGVGRLVVLPHPEADLDGLLQSLHAFRQRREGDAEAARLLLVPRGADAKPGSSA